MTLARRTPWKTHRRSKWSRLRARCASREALRAVPLRNISLRGDGAELQLAVAGYERQAVADATDANWLRAHVDVTVAGFAASLEMAMLTEDVERLLGQLSSVLDRGEGTAEFSSLENVLRFTVRLERTGRGFVSGAVRHLDFPQNRLFFAFETDRTFLDHAKTDLRSVTTVFPSRRPETTASGPQSQTSDHMRRFTCPSCGYLTFTEPPGSDEFCPVCGWQDDLSQLRFPNLAGGANRPCLIEAQRNYATLGTSDPQRTVRSAPATALPRDPDWRPIDASRDRLEETATGEIGDTYERDSTVYYYWRARP